LRLFQKGISIYIPFYARNSPLASKWWQGRDNIGAEPSILELQSTDIEKFICEKINEISQIEVREDLSVLACIGSGIYLLEPEGNAASACFSDKLKGYATTSLIAKGLLAVFAAKQAIENPEQLLSHYFNFLRSRNQGNTAYQLALASALIVFASARSEKTNDIVCKEIEKKNIVNIYEEAIASALSQAIRSIKGNPGFRMNDNYPQMPPKDSIGYPFMHRDIKGLNSYFSGILAKI